MLRRGCLIAAFVGLTARSVAGQPADSPEVLLALARQYALSGELDRAITSYERSLTIIAESTAPAQWKGQEPIIRFNLAMLHAAKGADLFRTDNLEDAISSFRTSLEWNPHSRDIRYNLCQAMYIEASQLRDRGGPHADVSALYMDILSEAGRVREADPANVNLVRLLAYSYRALGEEARANELLDESANLDFEVGDVRMDVDDSETTVSGAAKNLRLTPGAPIRLRISIVTFSGQIAAAADVDVAAPAAGDAAPFAVTIHTTEDVAGWRYEARHQ
jgi:tetratricopeptide (TPR) repeat protein